MDEHNDAFFHWHYYIEKGYIPKEGNYLLHIDHHDDFVCAGYDGDLQDMPQNPAQALQLVDRALGIADFIAPAIWQGIFSTFHILKNVLPMPFKDEEEFMSLKGTSELFRGKYIPLLHAQKRREKDSDYRFYTLRTGGLMPGDEISGENVVLDVDLDYFCWDNSLSTVSPKRIEITRKAYMEYMSDRNHPFRLIPIKYVKAVEEDGRFYLEYKEHIAPNKRPSDERILKRMDKLLEWVKSMELNIAAIDVCRSSYSGYLPADKAQLVESEFMKRLAQTYEIEVEDAYKNFKVTEF